MPDLTTGLEAYYRYQNSLADSSGNGRDGVGASVAYGTGKLGRGLYRQISESTVPPLDGVVPASGTFSLSVWFSTAAANSFLSLVGVMLEDDGSVGLYTASGVVETSGTDFPVSHTPAADGWHHAVIVVTGGEAELWVDGVSRGTSPVSDTSPLTGAVFANVVYVSDSFVGVPLDEFAVYSVALDADQVAMLYNSGSGYDPTASGTVCGTFSVSPRVTGTFSVSPAVTGTCSVEEC